MSSLRRNRSNRRPFNYKRLLWVAIPLVLLAILNVPYFQVTQAVIASSGSVPKDEAHRIVVRTLQERILFVAPRSFVLFPQAKAIEHDLVQAFPRANRIRVERTQLAEVTVTFEDRDPEGIWCGLDGGCLLIDADGLGYGVAPETSSAVYLTITGTSSPKIGSHVLPVEEARTLLFTFHTLREKNDIRTDSLVLGEQIYEARLASGVRVLFTPDIPLEEFAISLRSMLTSLKDKPNVEYIDLRFPGKAYFRIHGQYVDQVKEGA